MLRCDCDEYTQYDDMCVSCKRHYDREYAYHYNLYKSGQLAPLQSHVDAWNEKQRLTR